MRMDSAQQLVDAVLDDVEARQQWDERQAALYELRRHGLRRTRPPFPNASDVHFPLADTAIEQLKPYYFAQLYTSDRLASFRPLSTAAAIPQEAISLVEEWFDDQLKNNSNFEQELIRAVDYMLQCGKGVMKVVPREDLRKIEFRAISPQYIIVPPNTINLWDAHRVTHVVEMSREAFLADDRYKSAHSYVDRIAGRGKLDEVDGARQSRYRLEGITEADDDSRIVLWEVWKRVKEGWEAHTVSPVDPNVTICQPFQCPYEFADPGKTDTPTPPFVDFNYEIVGDNGWYSPRGITELSAMFQQEAKKIVDAMNDYSTFVLSPLFKSRTLPVASRVRLSPGSVLPHDVEPVQMPPLPSSVDKLLLLFRDLAERRVAMPDYGMTQLKNPSEPRTATEIDAVMRNTSQNIDLRMRIFRLSLGRLYQIAWVLLRHVWPEGAAVFTATGVRELGPEAFMTPWMVRPAGGVTGEPRAIQYRKAFNRFMLFRGDPFIDQAELRKCVLEADDAGLVKRLYRDAEDYASDEAEEQAIELAAMKTGFPAKVDPTDLHNVHLDVILAYGMSALQGQQQISCHEAQALIAHAMRHLFELQKIDKAAAKAYEEKLSMLLQSLNGGSSPPSSVQPQQASQTAPLAEQGAVAQPPPAPSSEK